MFAVPGPFDLQAGVSLMRHKLPYLYGIDLRQGLAEGFGFKPAHVRFLNSATRICWAKLAPEPRAASRSGRTADVMGSQAFAPAGRRQFRRTSD